MSLNRLHSAGYMTNWAARLFALAIEQRLKPHGIAPAYLPVFFALGPGKPLSQKALAALAAVEQPTMAATLNRMERDGLIERTPDPADRRSSLISLSELASGKLEVVRQATADINARALSSLTEAECATFLTMLEKIIERLDPRGRGQ
ncbi:MarR family winged helix-turn-helix transcriptional regulator [Rhodospirillum rubrum]|uniref:Transcriptional regulator, MarR family n=1 Tax=Rhodospirillum rubrum (strain ATCC 11170 / ATH 1.1.1 / DSM 467 / LMG 4362 / NCIMB 8255 / S1) TaxID=269796 RepID=Q2RUF3_RHORT|nr:MarR family transcriptional regulator [Rhodospirillum rubrum]ABC22242.1 transcriptional regulator, MarR family [Rhodospirillum rubrum ATCC 11170]AEO47958.1 MarR family transcriptional regulator [Rhodospirillum rubrum F11]MBK5953808.1 MarR family transcriptional regulator [Rhodospirillum rubrum]QXG81886.1 MarR family transcriptional regulator [Rhodospirillum rubrum]HAP99370.1 MarR family transcriptional regulator [Rhodospirillum rubrum]